MLVDFVLDDRQLPDQRRLERHQIQLSRARPDLRFHSSPLVRGPHWIGALDRSMDGSARAMWPKNFIHVCGTDDVSVSDGWSVRLHAADLFI